MTNFGRLYFLMLICAGFAVPTAYAAGGLYMAGFRGLNVASSPVAVHSSDKSFSGALGVRLSPRWRMESALSFEDRGFLHDENNNPPPMAGEGRWAGLMNVYYDFKTASRFKPYLTLGAGLAKSFSQETAGDEARFTWQAGTGFDYNVSPEVTFSSAYRFEDSPTSAYEQNTGGHEVHVGVKYALPVRPRHHARGLND